MKIAAEILQEKTEYKKTYCGFTDAELMSIVEQQTPCQFSNDNRIWSVADILTGMYNSHFLTKYSEWKFCRLV